MVPKPTGEMEEEGTHQEGPRQASPQRAPGYLQWRAYSCRGAEEERDREAAEEVAEESGAPAAETGCQGSQRGLGNAQERMGGSAGVWLVTDTLLELLQLQLILLGAVTAETVIFNSRKKLIWSFLEGVL